MPMFLKKIRSEGLAHLSYVIGHGNQAAVIDPRRDIETYIETAARHEALITHIFETHRNEDYVVGSPELARRTGAEIHHGKALDFKYGTPVSEGDRFELGDLVLEILETPGHTYESISIAVSDKSSGGKPVAVFTGDCLFVGDVGRTDFYPDKAEEVAGLLYDSIFNKLLPLGDHVILLPAHGAGSVCGSGMADREFSTLGHERLNNPVLQKKNRDDFIRYKVDEKHYKPPYFRQMEEYNQTGSAPDVGFLTPPRPLDAGRFEKEMNNGMIGIDIRSPEAFAGAFILDTLSIPVDMVAAFAGWFLPYDRPIGLVATSFADAETCRRHLLRLGYDNVRGYLSGGLTSWEVSGRKFGRIPAVHANELVRRIENDVTFTLLDVRSDAEVASGRLPKSRHIYIGELPGRLDEVPRDQPVVTFCGSGLRAIIAASILKRNGFEQVEESLGSMAACAAVGCPIIKD